jgi:lipoate-protein ligase A
VSPAPPLPGPFGPLEWIDDRVPRDGPANMALDEVLAGGTSAVFRCYRWDRPTVSIGYFGSASAARAAHPGAALVRRATGGGLVLHGGDFTYALALPRPLRFPAADLYRAVHARLAAALRAAGFEAELAPDDCATAACFAGWSRHDLLLGGRKIAGAAQRRTRRGLLLQGSVQGVGLPEGFGDLAAAALGSPVSPRGWRPEELERAGRIARERYADPAWTERRA